MHLLILFHHMLDSVCIVSCTVSAQTEQSGEDRKRHMPDGHGCHLRNITGESCAKTFVYISSSKIAASCQSQSAKKSEMCFSAGHFATQKIIDMIVIKARVELGCQLSVCRTDISHAWENPDINVSYLCLTSSKVWNLLTAILICKDTTSYK